VDCLPFKGSNLLEAQKDAQRCRFPINDDYVFVYERSGVQKKIQSWQPALADSTQFVDRRSKC
jgi:hypothetical protein